VAAHYETSLGTTSYALVLSYFYTLYFVLLYFALLYVLRNTPHRKRRSPPR